MLPIGSVIDGKYKILNKIGQGGMSIVYLAMNERANKQWAVKEVRRDGILDFEMVKQSLIAETELMKKLHHPNLPCIVDVIDRDDTFLIVMDYIEGRSLDSIVREHGALNQDMVVGWAKQFCDVLGYLHSRKPPVIYRDMKPANVMLKPDGKIMLIDFGIAREFKAQKGQDTEYLGTRGYAAPEQYGGGGQTDARTDIYCLGMTLYHLLTGQTSCESFSEQQPLHFEDSSISSGLKTIIRKCTQRNPKDRYQSCAELLYDIEHYTELETQFQRAQSRRWRMFIAEIAVTVLAGIGAAAFRGAESYTTFHTYETYIKEANSLESVDPERSVEFYTEAIRLAPSIGKGYEEMLRFFLWQKNEENEGEMEAVCVFSSDEEQQMRKVLGITGENGKSNEEYLAGNREDYGKFAYELGLAYFYSYRGTGNKTAAVKWLQIAAETPAGGKLNDKNIRRAEKLLKIAAYYERLGIRNQAGDSMVSYADYWGDLSELIGEEGKDQDNHVETLLTFKELSSQIFASAKNFKSAGITKAQMRLQLRQIKDSLDSMEISEGDAYGEYEAELKQTVYDYVDLAENSLTAVFNAENLR